MSIAFCGDSFCEICEEQPYLAWTNLLWHHYDANIVCDGMAGRALIHSYEKLLPVVDKADYVIFCITDPARLPNREALPMFYNPRPGIRCTGRAGPSSTIEQSALKYYKHIFYEEYHNMAQKGILMQIDELMVQKQKKCIWFPCFENSMQEYIPQSGPIADISLGEISFNEYKNKGFSKKKYSDVKIEDDRKCHLSEENNIRMANLIIDIIKNDNFNPKEIKLGDYFNG